MQQPNPLGVAFSPCPNDTYLFHPWIEGRVGSELPMNPILGDIEQLNSWALKRRFPVSKVSIACLGQILDEYVLLPTGCALGHQCGPKLIAKYPIQLTKLAGKRIAVPGRYTTAYLLLQLLCDIPFQPVFCAYHKIAELIEKREVEAGLIIHETRFTFAKLGFAEIGDLGQLWHARYALPLPLGGIVAKRELGINVLAKIMHCLAQSLEYAKNHPQQSTAFILKHSQEKHADIVQEHINLYINAETAKLSTEGRKAIETLFLAARERGFIPQSMQPWLLDEVEQINLL